MKTIFIFPVVCLLLFSCEDKNSICGSAADFSTNGQTHYEISLNTDNYWKYLRTTSVVNVNSIGNSSFTFEGVLSYALYADVVATLRLDLKGYDDSTTSVVTQIPLDASGYGYVVSTPNGFVTGYSQTISNASSSRRTFNLVDITGTVIFNV